MKELVVISGKGGTGKTSLVASFAALSNNAVFADCDVDAADLHLILSPDIRYREPFSGGSVARIRPDACTSCGTCHAMCRFDAVHTVESLNGLSPAIHHIDPIACEGCGVCAWFCPSSAIDFAPAVNGEWYRSDTRHGPMIHARLGIAEENSGKLVTRVREEARQTAVNMCAELILVDGSPGIGCPVISSITGADLVLAITEPTCSGQHDLERVLKLTRFFNIPVMVAVNKWDINPSLTTSIEAMAKQAGATLAGRLRYDRSVTDAMVQHTSVIEYGDCAIGEDIRALWNTISHELGIDNEHISDTIKEQKHP